MEAPNSTGAEASGGDLDLFLAAGTGRGSEVDRLLFLNPPSVLRLLKACTRQENFTALHVAAMRGDEEIVVKLLIAIHSVANSEDQERVLVNSKDCIGRTPLHHAAWMQRESVMKTLLGYPLVDINAQDKDNFTPIELLLSKWGGGVKVLMPLLGHGDIKLDDLATQSEETRNFLNSAELLHEAWRKDVAVPRLSDYVLSSARVPFTEMMDKIFEQLILVMEGSIEKTSKNTRMHVVAYFGLHGLMKTLARRPDFLPQINAENSECRTPLHLAALMGHLELVQFLNQQPTLRADGEDELSHTAAEIAFNLQKQDRRHVEIFRVLMRREDMKEYVSIQKEKRGAQVTATNAVMVGSALFAGISFQGWLQPPLGYQVFYQFPRDTTIPDQFKQFAAIGNTSLKVFWVFNSLSFYCSVAAIFVGTDILVPRSKYFISTEASRMKDSLKLALGSFAFAVVYAIVAFTAAGFACLPPIFRYQLCMIVPLVVGMVICFSNYFGSLLGTPIIHQIHEYWQYFPIGKLSRQEYNLQKLKQLYTRLRKTFSKNKSGYTQDGEGRIQSVWNRENTSWK